MVSLLVCVITKQQQTISKNQNESVLGSSGKVAASTKNAHNWVKERLGGITLISEAETVLLRGTIIFFVRADFT